MQFVNQFVDQFADLFKGHPDHYGVHVPDPNPMEGIKSKGESYTESKPVTQNLYMQHLHGEKSIGIHPLDSNNNVRFCAIDVDVYPLDPQKYLTILGRAGLPLVAFRSKSGGLHLYLFFKEDTPAIKALPHVQAIRQLLNLPRDTEIFPKQTRLVGNAFGNFINIPYFNFSATARWAYDFNGNKLSLAQALEMCMTSRITLKTLDELMKKLPLSAAPPCLQTIYMGGGADEGERNIFLFNCATYLKARFGDQFADKLHLLNTNILNPVEYTELDQTIIASHNKREYSYQCKNSILFGYCDKEICKKRKYGYQSNDISDLSYEKLVQVKCSEPYYIWKVNGVDMIFYSAADLMNQTKFKEYCLEYLHVVPRRMTEQAWLDILNRALENLIVEEVEEIDDLSNDSLWVNKVSEFLTRQQAVRPMQIEDGLIWYSAQTGRIHFKGAMLLEYLEQSSTFRTFSATRHHNLLKKFGAVQTRLNCGKGKVVRSWSFNLKAVQARGYLIQLQLDKFELSDTKIEPDDSKEDKVPDTMDENTPIDFIGKEKF